MSEWLLIDNGFPAVTFIGYGDYGDGAKGIFECLYRDGSFWRSNNGYGFTVTCYPTHYMPLPGPPEK